MLRLNFHPKHKDEKKSDNHLNHVMLVSIGLSLLAKLATSSKPPSKKMDPLHRNPGSPCKGHHFTYCQLEHDKETHSQVISIFLDE